jgi:hypothetical protein
LPVNYLNPFGTTIKCRFPDGLGGILEMPVIRLLIPCCQSVICGFWAEFEHFRSPRKISPVFFPVIWQMQGIF